MIGISPNFSRISIQLVWSTAVFVEWLVNWLILDLAMMPKALHIFLANSSHDMIAYTTFRQWVWNLDVYID